MHYWTKAEEQKCLRMIRNGKKYPEIAAALGLYPDQVKRFVYRKRLVEPEIWKKIANTGKKTKQKCTTCYYASGAINLETGWKCPWADRLEPMMDEWDASPTSYLVDKKAKRVMHSFLIRDCKRYVEG